jgi:hypothetical protein
MFKHDCVEQVDNWWDTVVDSDVAFAGRANSTEKSYSNLVYMLFTDLVFAFINAYLTGLYIKVIMQVQSVKNTYIHMCVWYGDRIFVTVVLSKCNLKDLYFCSDSSFHILL